MPMSAPEVAPGRIPSCDTHILSVCVCRKPYTLQHHKARPMPKGSGSSMLQFRCSCSSINPGQHSCSGSWRRHSRHAVQQSMQQQLQPRCASSPRLQLSAHHQARRLCLEQPCGQLLFCSSLIAHSWPMCHKAQLVSASHGSCVTTSDTAENAACFGDDVLKGLSWPESHGLSGKCYATLKLP